MTTLMFSLALVLTMQAAARATPADIHPVKLAECFTVMSGLPYELDLFEDRDDRDQPMGSGQARVVSKMMDDFVAQNKELIESEAPQTDLRHSRLVITTAPDHRAVVMYASLDPDAVFVRFDLTRGPRAQQVLMKTPSGQVWSDFECISAEPGAASAPE